MPLLEIIQGKIKQISFAPQEQERQRSIDKRKEEVEKKSLEKKKEEVDDVQKLHMKLKQEQQRWDKECLAREKQQVSLTRVLGCSLPFLSCLSGSTHTVPERPDVHLSYVCVFTE